jgi:NADH dehydrogenase
MGDVGQVIPVAANIRDEASVAAAIAGSDAVINLIGILYERGRQTFDAVHTEGAARIARVATSDGIDRLVHVSAIGADEQALAHYSQSKGLGERQVTEAFKNATIIRPSILFGPEDKFFNFFAGIARLAPALPLIGGGHTRFQPVYVCDAAEAIVAALSDTSSVGRTYEIGGPETYSFRELMDIMLGVIKRRRLLLPVPFWATAMDGAFIETSLNVLAKFAGTIVPAPPITQDQVRLLRSDNVVSGDMPGLAELGITPTALDVILPTYLARYRRGGSKKDELSASVSRH